MIRALILALCLSGCGPVSYGPVVSGQTIQFRVTFGGDVGLAPQGIAVEMDDD